MQWDHLDSDAGEARSVARVEAGGVRLVGLGALPPAVVHLDDAVSGADAEHREENEESDAVDVGRLTALKECIHSFHSNLKGNACYTDIFVYKFIEVVAFHS